MQRHASGLRARRCVSSRARSNRTLPDLALDKCVRLRRRRERHHHRTQCELDFLASLEYQLMLGLEQTYWSSKEKISLAIQLTKILLLRILRPSEIWMAYLFCTQIWRHSIHWTHGGLDVSSVVSSVISQTKPAAIPLNLVALVTPSTVRTCSSSVVKNRSQFHAFKYLVTSEPQVNGHSCDTELIMGDGITHAFSRHTVITWYEHYVNKLLPMDVVQSQKRFHQPKSHAKAWEVSWRTRVGVACRLRGRLVSIPGENHDNRIVQSM